MANKDILNENMQVTGGILQEECNLSSCICGDHENCEAMERHRKLLYCDAAQCAYNVSISEPKFIKYSRDWKPLGPADGYKGLCGRPEVGLRYEKIIATGNVQKAAKCAFYTDKRITGHIDFARLLAPGGQPYGGNIPDPVNPGAAYGV
jgi:hypothetical protein